MDKRLKVALALVGVVALCAIDQTTGWMAGTAYVPPVPGPLHDCSDGMKASLALRADGDKYRKAFCEDGGEAKLDQMMKDAQDERPKPAF